MINAAYREIVRSTNRYFCVILLRQFFVSFNFYAYVYFMEYSRKDFIRWCLDNDMKCVLVRRKYISSIFSGYEKMQWFLSRMYVLYSNNYFFDKVEKISYVSIHHLSYRNFFINISWLRKQKGITKLTPFVVCKSLIFAIYFVIYLVTFILSALLLVLKNFLAISWT